MDSMRTRLVRRSAVSVASLTAALVFGACGDGGPSLVDSAPPDLAGTTWVMTSASGSAAITAIAGTEVVITFEDGQVGVQAGCNGMGGAYEQNDDVLEVEPMTSTLRACDQPLMYRDAALAALHTSGPTVAGDADTLVITGDGTTLELAARS
jgi:heat shock protein HslJ